MTSLIETDLHTDTTPEAVAYNAQKQAQYMGMDTYHDPETGRLNIHWQLEDIRIHTRSIPARVITAEETQEIISARSSYKKAWAYNGAGERLEGDPFDAFPNAQNPDQQRAYINATTHQLTTFKQPGREIITLTHRVVGGLNQAEYPQVSFPDDLAFWQVRNKITRDRIRSFPEQQRLYVANQWPNKYSPFEGIQAITRTAKHPYPGSTDPLERDMSAAGFAMNQLACLIENKRPVWVCMLRHDFPQKVLGIPLSKEELIYPALPSSAEALRLPEHEEIVLDRQLDDVKLHLFHFPGYWQNQHDSLKMFRGLIEEGKLQKEDLAPRYNELRQSLPDPSRLVPTDQATATEMVNSLTKPPFAKYLVPLYTREGNINKGLSGDHLRHKVLTEVRDGAYSSTLFPTQWQQSTFRVLNAFQLKAKNQEQYYTSSTTR